MLLSLEEVLKNNPSAEMSSELHECTAADILVIYQHVIIPVALIEQLISPPVNNCLMRYDNELLFYVSDQVSLSNCIFVLLCVYVYHRNARNTLKSTRSSL